MFAGSNAAQADSFHAMVHGGWYFLAILVGKRINALQLSIIDERRYRAWFGLGNFTLLCIMLGYVGFAAFPKLKNPTPIVSHYMFLSVCIGLIGNIIALVLLKKFDRKHETHQWLSLDTFADFWISMAVLIASIILWIAPDLNIHYSVDAVLTFIAIIWIFGMALVLLCVETIKNL